jgi:polysaccharide pyruvyl transferase WcaK-like protein
MRKYALVISSGCLFSNNMGCNALTYGAVEVLERVAKKLGAEFDYYLVGNPADGVVPPELGAARVRLIDHLPSLGPRGLLKNAYLGTLAQQFAVRDVLDAADLFLDNGWGDSFSDIYGQARLEAMLWNMNFALKRKKPLLLLPQTVGPFAPGFALRKQVERVLRSACGVYVRDPLSHACVQELAPGLEAFQTDDVALFMGYAKRAAPKAGSPVVGINPSGLLWRGGYTGKNQFGLADDYPGVIRALIGRLLSAGAAVELLGHDISGPNAGNRCDDYYVCKLLQREFPACRVAPFFYSPVEAKSYVSGLSLLIGSRMHCCIAAYSSGVPVLPLAYSRKFSGLFSDALAYPHMADLTRSEAPAILETATAMLGSLDTIAAELAAGQRELDRYRDALVDDMAVTIQRGLSRR